MRTFLGLISHMNWRAPPRVWNDEFRKALSDDLVRVGWGGVLVLTEDGAKQILTDGEEAP